VVAAVVEAAVAKALAVAAAVIRAGVAAAAEGPEVVIQEAAAEEGVKAPAAAAHLGVVEVEVEATPEDPAAAVKVAEAARVLVGVRAAVVADKGAAMAGAPAVGAIDSYKGSGGCRLPDGPFSFPGHRTARLHGAYAAPPGCTGGWIMVYIGRIPSQPGGACEHATRSAGETPDRVRESLSGT
ncbi:MAG TPA: hypothetical protein VNO19_03075, partial [Gemmatimonadales bacterium]|nr:hypothetical protein [Gemmatimonadales bacterium]